MPEYIETLNKQAQQFIIKASEDGENDARRNDGDVITSSITRIKSKFQNIILKLEGHALEQFGPHRETYYNLSDELKHLEQDKDPNAVKDKLNYIDGRLKDNEQELRAAHKRSISEIGELVNTLNKRLKVVESDIAQKKVDLTSVPFDNKWNPTVGFVVIVVLTFLEIPFTQSGLLITRAPQNITWTFAILICVILAFCAHFIGGWLKSKSNRWMTGIAIMFGISIIYIVAALRTMFIKKLDFEFGNMFSLDALLFSVIGFGIFFICIVISFFSHNSSKLASKRVKSYKRTLNRLEIAEKEIKKKIDNEMAKKESAFAELQDSLKKAKAEAEREKSNLKENIVRTQKKSDRRKAASQFNQILSHHKSYEAQLSERYKEALSAYKNAYARQHGIFFKNSNDPLIEQELKTLKTSFDSAGELMLPLSKMNNLPL